MISGGSKPVTKMGMEGWTGKEEPNQKYKGYKRSAPRDLDLRKSRNSRKSEIWTNAASGQKWTEFWLLMTAKNSERQCQKPEMATDHQGHVQGCMGKASVPVPTLTPFRNPPAPNIQSRFEEGMSLLCKHCFKPSPTELFPTRLLSKALLYRNSRATTENQNDKRRDVDSTTEVWVIIDNNYG